MLVQQAQEKRSGLMSCARATVNRRWERSPMTLTNKSEIGRLPHKEPEVVPGTARLARSTRLLMQSANTRCHAVNPCEQSMSQMARTNLHRLEPRTGSNLSAQHPDRDIGASSRSYTELHCHTFADRRLRKLAIPQLTPPPHTIQELARHPYGLRLPGRR